MKRFIVKFILILILIVSFVGCGGDSEKIELLKKAPVIELDYGSINSVFNHESIGTVDEFAEVYIERLGLNKDDFEKISFSERTCLCAEKLATTSNPPRFLNIFSKVGLAKSIGYGTKSSGTYNPRVDRISRVNSANAFSLISTTTKVFGLKGKIALIYDEPIDPAPPITRIFFPPILLFNVS